MSQRERDEFITEWERDAQGTIKLLQALPKDKYDFKPDPGGRSLGELAWHLAELDAYMTHGLELGRFDMSGSKPPGIERPRSVEALASGYERVHREAVERLRKIDLGDLDRQVTYFDGKPMRIREILWIGLMHHLIHHRGELVLMCRLAGGTPPGLFGPNREEMAAMKART